jgi:drug/metabolite transporter (DMT)-like permease
MPVTGSASLSDAGYPRLRRVHAAGVFSGLAAGAWLGAAEAPTKVVSIGVSPMVISLSMVLGVFLARWSLPALIQGTSYVRADLRQVPHLVIWGVLAGCLWAVANTLTIFAIRDIGLSIAFPLWNTNSLVGILWGVLFFNELRDAGWSRRLGVLSGAVLMFGGATLLALASSVQAPHGDAARGVVAALAAGLLWGTMYIPYRKAYLSGMSPLSFVTFFTLGELGMMLGLAMTYSGGPGALWGELVSARDVLFWLLLGGFVWVVGDLFQQYAVKYIGISRGIPLSNTNQLWGLLWGILVFGELAGRTRAVHVQVVGGAALMALGAAAVALCSATGREHHRWQEAADRERERYRIDPAYLRTTLEGKAAREAGQRRTWLDWFVVVGATATFAGFAALARPPGMALAWSWVVALTFVMLVLLAACGMTLWRTTRFR